MFKGSNKVPHFAAHERRVVPVPHDVRLEEEGGNYTQQLQQQPMGQPQPPSANSLFKDLLDALLRTPVTCRGTTKALASRLGFSGPALVSVLQGPTVGDGVHVIKSPCQSGKTMIMAAIAAVALAHGRPVIIVVKENHSNVQVRGYNKQGICCCLSSDPGSDQSMGVDCC